MKYSCTTNTLKSCHMNKDFCLFVSLFLVSSVVCLQAETDTCNILPLKLLVVLEIMKGIELVSAEIKISNGKLLMEIV